MLVQFSYFMRPVISTRRPSFIIIDPNDRPIVVRVSGNTIRAKIIATIPNEQFIFLVEHQLVQRVRGRFEWILRHLKVFQTPQPWKPTKSSGADRLYCSSLVVADLRRSYTLAIIDGDGSDLSACSACASASVLFGSIKLMNTVRVLVLMASMQKTNIISIAGNNTRCVQ